MNIGLFYTNKHEDDVKVLHEVLQNEFSALSIPFEVKGKEKIHANGVTIHLKNVEKNEKALRTKLHFEVIHLTDDLKSQKEKILHLTENINVIPFPTQCIVDIALFVKEHSREETLIQV